MKQKDILFLLLEKTQFVTITVCGVSMEPTMHEGDSITVEKCADYQVGDVVVFRYKYNELLVHRIVKKDERLYCKGDNAFLMENIATDQIAGKVVKINSQPIENWPMCLIELSLKIGLEFRKQHYDIEVTKQTDIYKQYAKAVSSHTTDINSFPTQSVDL